MLDQSEKAYPARPDLTLETVDQNTSYAKVLDLIGSAEKILDVGCASGYLARLLTERHCTVTGLDLNADALAGAAKFCSRTVAADLDREDIAELFGDEKFDAIVFADVLEHVRDPWRVLDRAREILVDGGSVIASIPNIAHGAIRLALLAGKFDYSEFGILDDTHLRFFTRRTVMELFVRSGFAVERVERTILPLFTVSNLVPHVDEEAFDVATIASVRQDAECETLQFVVKGTSLRDSEKWNQITKFYIASNRQIEETDERRTVLDLAATREGARVAAVYEQQIREREEQICALEEMRATLEHKSADLSVLHDRAINESVRVRQIAARADEEIADLHARNEQIATALVVASAQVESLNARCMALERHSSRLAAEHDDERARVNVAERFVHNYLTNFADERGNIDDAAAVNDSIATLRSAYPIMVAQIESMDVALSELAVRRQRVRGIRARSLLRKAMSRIRRMCVTGFHAALLRLSGRRRG